MNTTAPVPAVRVREIVAKLNAWSVEHAEYDRHDCDVWDVIVHVPEYDGFATDAADDAGDIRCDDGDFALYDGTHVTYDDLEPFADPAWVARRDGKFIA